MVGVHKPAFIMATARLKESRTLGVFEADVHPERARAFAAAIVLVGPRRSRKDASGKRQMGCRYCISPAPMQSCPRYRRNGQVTREALN